MNRFDPLTRMGVINAWEQLETVAQLNQRHAFEATQDFISRYRPARNQPVAVIPVSYGEEPMRLYRLPETKIIQAFKPGFHVLDVVKNSHSTIVSQSCFKTQFLAQEMSTDGK